MTVPDGRPATLTGANPGGAVRVERPPVVAVVPGAVVVTAPEPAETADDRADDGMGVPVVDGADGTKSHRKVR